jgi:hypothetical protein
MSELDQSDGFASFRHRIQSAALGALADHWHYALGNKRLPAWASIQPSRIAPHLKRVFAFTYDGASGEITRSFAGSEVLSLVGWNSKGTPVQNLQAPRLALRMHLTVSRVVLGPTFYRGTGKLFQQGAHVVEGERIVLPLSSDGVTGDGAFGASDYYCPEVEASTDPVDVLHDIEEWFPV